MLPDPSIDVQWTLKRQKPGYQKRILMRILFLHDFDEYS
jgi:hypothetical protein